VPTTWILVSSALRLGLDPLEGVWYLFVLVTGHHIGLYTTLVVALWLAGATAVAASLRARRRPPRERDEPAPSLGPAFAPTPGSAVRR